MATLPTKGKGRTPRALQVADHWLPPRAPARLACLPPGLNHRLAARAESGCGARAWPTAPKRPRDSHAHAESEKRPPCGQVARCMLDSMALTCTSERSRGEPCWREPPNYTPMPTREGRHSGPVPDKAGYVGTCCPGHMTHT